MKKITQKESINYINKKEVFDAGTLYSFYDFFYNDKGQRNDSFYFIKSYQMTLAVIIDDNIIMNGRFISMTTRGHQAILKQSKYNIIYETEEFNIFNLTKDKKTLSLFRKKLKIEKHKKELESLLTIKIDSKKQAIQKI